jgi:hypothetical protein
VILASALLRIIKGMTMLHTLLKLLNDILFKDHSIAKRDAYLAQAIDVYDLEYRQKYLQKTSHL